MNQREKYLRDVLAQYWPNYFTSESTRKQWVETHLAPPLLSSPVTISCVGTQGHGLQQFCHWTPVLLLTEVILDELHTLSELSSFSMTGERQLSLV